LSPEIFEEFGWLRSALHDGDAFGDANAARTLGGRLRL
jgi:hypothetical protein